MPKKDVTEEPLDEIEHMKDDKDGIVKITRDNKRILIWGDSKKELIRTENVIY